MIEAIVDSIRINVLDRSRILLLRELAGDRHLPIWIGEFEAHAIVLEMQGTTPQRPMPYDLMMNMVQDLDARVIRVVVNDLSHDIYYARVVLQRGGDIIELDSRPSDAVAIAVRAGCPIFVDDTVMDRAGVSIEDEDEIEEGALPDARSEEPTHRNEAEEEGLNIFRDFINTIEFDDRDQRSN
ncbi:MAG: bifunctional nuclease family protein [Chloroflexota bacterium]|jgi:bifunctional DNase/RNase|nr:bifunctional nuclease family protein [Chloroflexota bacterium]